MPDVIPPALEPPSRSVLSLCPSALLVPPNAQAKGSPSFGGHMAVGPSRCEAATASEAKAKAHNLASPMMKQTPAVVAPCRPRLPGTWRDGLASAVLLHGHISQTSHSPETWPPVWLVAPVAPTKV